MYQDLITRFAGRDGERFIQSRIERANAGDQIAAAWLDKLRADLAHDDAQPRIYAQI